MNKIKSKAGGSNAEPSSKLGARIATDIAPKTRLAGKWDVLLIVVLLLVGGTWIALLSLTRESCTVNIYVDGELWERRTVDSDTAAYTLKPPVDPPLVLEGEGNRIWFAQAECPNKLCVKSGKLGATANAAACIPARVAVVVESAKSKKKLDAISY